MWGLYLLSFKQLDGLAEQLEDVSLIVFIVFQTEWLIKQIISRLRRNKKQCLIHHTVFLSAAQVHKRIHQT